MTCKFCEQLLDDERLLSTAHFSVIREADAIEDGHVLIVSHAHIVDMRELTAGMVQELFKLTDQLITLFEQTFQLTGVRVIHNHGTLMEPHTHFHIYMMPRYEMLPLFQPAYTDTTYELHERINEAIRQLAKSIT